MAKHRVVVLGSVGKSILVDDGLGPRLTALEARVAALGTSGGGRHSALSGLQVGNDHPQYTMWQAAEDIQAVWNFTAVPTIGGVALPEYVEDTIGGILVDTTTVDFTYDDTANTISAVVPGAALTKVDDTNVTLTLGGTPATALARAASLTLGWTGILAVARGGSGAGTLTGYLKGTGTTPFTASATIPYSDLSGTPTIPTAANPSGLIGMTAVNGAAATFLRSDGRHAIDPAISPTWTAKHTWNSNGVADAGIEVWRDDGLLQSNITSTGYALQGGGTFHGNFARGTRALPTAALSLDVTGGVGSRVYNGTAFQGSSPASIHWQTTENTSATNYGMWLRLLTTPKGTTTRQERGGVTDNGTFWSHDIGTFDASSSAQTLPITDARFVASGSGVANGSTFVAVTYGNAGGSSLTPGFRGMNARGTPAAPTASLLDDFLCFMGGHGHDGSTFTSGTKALVTFKAAENWSSTLQGTYITVETTPIGSTTRAEVARFASLRATFSVPVRLSGYTVAALPTGAVGDTAYATDALAPTFGAVVVGGGAIVTPVFYNGANWTCR